MKKQFCLNGHDVTICGRQPSGRCTECHRASHRSKDYKKWRKKYNKSDKIKKYFAERYQKAKQNGTYDERKWRKQGIRGSDGNLIKVQEAYSILHGQHEMCYICGKKGNLGLDHDHVTGKVRSFLCNRCNMYVGVLENKEIFQKVHDYLVFFKGK